MAVGGGIDPVASFRNLLGGTSRVQMRDFAAQASNDDVNAVLDYLVATRDGEITPPRPANPLVPQLDFGNVTAGQTSRLTFVLTNRRFAAFLLDMPTAVGSGQFTVDTLDCPGLSVPANGGTCTIGVTFAPSAAGPQTQELAFALHPGGGEVALLDRTGANTVTLAGTGIATVPGFSATPASLSLAAVAGQVATASTTIENTGNGALDLAAIDLLPAGASPFSVTGGTCAAGGRLLPGERCTIGVRYAPSVAGAASAAVSVSDNAPLSPHAVPLAGSATAAPQSFALVGADSLAFGETVVGSSGLLSFTVSNKGQAPLHFSGLALSGDALADYAVGGTCTTSVAVAVDASCQIAVTFTPGRTGLRVASLALQSDASNGTQAVGLSGTGLAVPVPIAAVSPATLDFQAQTFGGRYPPRVVTLSNPGTAALVVSAIDISGSAFSIVDAAGCLGSMSPGGQCVITIAFTPASAAETDSGTLTVASNLPPVTTLLTGSGTAAMVPVLAWSDATSPLGFGQSAVGQMSPAQTLRLVNQGPGGAQLTLVNAIGPDAASFTLTPLDCTFGQTVYQGGSCLFSVVFDPSSAGAKTASVQVVSSGSAPPLMALEGTGMGSGSLGFSWLPARLDFGEVVLGSRSTPSVLTLSNTGAQSLRVSAASVSGNYVLQPGTCPAIPFDLAAATTCTMNVQFAPTAAGAQPGNVSIQSAAQTDPSMVPLDGQGAEPDDLSSGGCSMSRGGGAVDPTLWALVALAAMALVARARRRAS